MQTGILPSNWACNVPVDPKLTGEAAPGCACALTQCHKNTCMVGKGKNQADAAAGKLLDRAGLGKQHGACGQVGGPIASHWQGGVGEGNPTKGCPGSASSTETRPVASGRTELAGAARSCHESSGKEGVRAGELPGKGRQVLCQSLTYNWALPNPLPAFSSAFPACKLPAPWAKLFWYTAWLVCWARNG